MSDLEPVRSRSALRSAAAVSLLAGLCPLIPLPFVDDWAENLVRRRAVRDRLRAGGFEVTPGDVEVLAGLEADEGDGGCLRLLLWPVLRLAAYLVRKLFRKVVFVFAVHDAVNAAASLFHDAWLVSVAVGSGALGAAPGRRLDRDRLRRVRRAMDDTVRDVDRRPLERAVRRAFAGSRRVAAAAARRLGRWARGERRATRGSPAGGPEAAQRAVDDLPLEAEEQALGGMVDRMVDALWLEPGYLAALEQRFNAHLADRLAAADDAPPP
jgi:hypothetical protein